MFPEVEIENRSRISTDNLLDKILSTDNMYRGMQGVIRNKGSHDVDGINKINSENNLYCILVA